MRMYRDNEVKFPWQNKAKTVVSPERKTQYLEMRAGVQCFGITALSPSRLSLSLPPSFSPSFVFALALLLPYPSFRVLLLLLLLVVLLLAFPLPP